MHLYEEQFAATHDFPPAVCSKVLVIASTPRCGSHMLGHALYSTGQFGFPLEYANPINRSAWRDRFGTDSLDALMRSIVARRTSPNGVFSIKVHYEHLREFGGFQAFRQLFPDAYYVVLARDDLLKQAVSYALAQQTGVWIAGQRASGVEPQYDFDRIDRCLKNVVRQNAAWRYQLAANGCRRLELGFEDVAANLDETIDRIARFMEISIETRPSGRKISTAPQSSGINAEWTRQFLSEFREGDLFGSTGAQPAAVESIWRRVKSKVKAHTR